MSKITTTQELETLELSFARMLLQYPGFIDFTIKRLVNDNIIKSIHDKMRSDGISNKIIDSTFLSTEKEKTSGTIRYYVISNYNADTPNGKFPVAVFIEEGRKAYIVNAPLPTPDRPNPHLKYKTKDGKTRFGKKSKIPRYVGRKYVEETIQEQAQFVQKLFNEEQNRWLQDNGLPIN